MALVCCRAPENQLDFALSNHILDHIRETGDRMLNLLGKRFVDFFLILLLFVFFAIFLTIRSLRLIIAFFLIVIVVACRRLFRGVALSLRLQRRRTFAAFELLILQKNKKVWRIVKYKFNAQASHSLDLPRLSLLRRRGQTRVRPSA